ncbi:MAG TPA: carbohydrate ABC transporter permease, partial [Spirochaetia bacterium]|nr:carbohydrate ABC transporter permease [Spirochaetia bacterium]
FENYPLAMKKGNWPRYFFNSAYISITSVALSLLFNSIAGYAFARLRFRGRDVLFLFALLGLMIPPQVTMVPLFIMMKNMPLFGGNNILGQGGVGWLNSYWGLIMPHLAGSFGVFLCRQYYIGFPTSIDEAAMIDGATRLQTYLTIYLPLSGPVLVTLAILKATFTWNEYIWPLVLTSSEEMMTVQLALSKFRTDFRIEWNLLMAATMLIIFPLLLLFLILQKYFVQGIVTSGMKN